jgi:uncharacterized protein YfaS (alpha-2-macroglobulin family)
MRRLPLLSGKYPCSALSTWRMALSLLATVALAAALGHAGTPATVPQVSHFSPQGTVKRVQQVSARFSEPMAPLGDPRSQIDPFSIDCSAVGNGRWLDSRTWVYDFGRELPGGLRCHFRLRAGLPTQAGVPLGGQRAFSFSTGGPAVLAAVPSHEARIEEDQVFVLGLDAPVNEASVLQQASFTVSGIPERIGVHILAGETRQAILDTLYGWSRREHVLVLQARQRFPSGATVRLIWGKGISALSGVAIEQDQILSFKVRDAFTAEFHCQRLSRQGACLPITPMHLRFSNAVAWEQARHVVLVDMQGQRRSPSQARQDEEAQFVTSVTFKGPFPESATFRVEVPTGLVDDAGRPLRNASRFPLQVKTADFPPLAKFAARFGIVEWKADPTLPVTLRNLEPEVHTRLLQLSGAGGDGSGGSTPPPVEHIGGTRMTLPADHPGEVLAWLRKVAAAPRDASVFQRHPGSAAGEPFLLPKPHGANPLEVVGIPLRAPGLYIVELESPRLGASLLGKPRPLYVPTSVLVTNLAVHFKWGRETSLIWVTTLDAGQPVPDAGVAVHDCAGKTLWHGQTDTQGLARVNALPKPEALRHCPYEGELFHFDYRQTTAINRLDGGLLVTARLEDDFSFVHSSWNRGIELWRFQLPSSSDPDLIVAHTVFDRPLYRAGDVVHMKHVLRQQVLNGFALVPEAHHPRRLAVRHVGSEETYELPLSWNGQGSAESFWSIPKGAKLGRYQVVLMWRPAGQGTNETSSEDEWLSGEFRLEEFRVPLMRALIQPPTEPQIAVSEIAVTLGVQYLAGGGANHLPVTLRALIRPKQVSFPEDFEGFAFANGTAKEGMVRQGSSGGGDSAEEEAAPPGHSPSTHGVHQRLDLVLDAAGTARASITKLPQLGEPADLLLELEFRDPNGEVQTVATAVPLWPAPQLVGMKTETWLATKGLLTTRLAVVDVRGQAVPHTPVQVDLLQRKVYSYRKRLVGGFYAYEHVQETRRVGEFCHAVTDAQGFASCAAKPPVDGNLILQASLAAGTVPAATAHQEVWASGTHPWRFDVQDHDRIDVLPEKRLYEPGETARLQVRMPFQEAMALVTLEREGVLDGYVTPLSGQEPVIELPVAERFAPNMFVSVLAVRGRVGEGQPSATVDLGRPSFKLGIAELRVGWRRHHLTVKVTSDRPTYQVRDKALIRVAVQTAAGQALPAGGEVAIAAIDEGLLELLPNTSWNLLEAMMGRRGYGVQTATAQLEVVGKRHYGLKALPQGGGGGRQPTRELFDTLLLWRGHVPLDANGEASVEVPLNDALTSFRIAAVATAGVELFGTGATTIRSSQEVMILPGISPIVREGDYVRSEFILRNTTERAMNLLVGARVEGLPAHLASQRLNLPPHTAQVVAWDVTVPSGVETLRYELEATDDGGASDRLRAVQRVLPAVPLRTFQATIAQWHQEIQQPIERPADALPDRGGVQVLLRPSIVDGIAPLRDWMRRYPYSCLEQQISRAVALRDPAQWQSIAEALPSFVDSDGLLKYFTAMEQGNDVLTAYALSVLHEAGWEIPTETRGRLLEGLQRFVDGTVQRRSPVAAADLSLRKLAAVEALSRYTTATPKALGSIPIEPNLWPTSMLLDWWSVLHRVPDIHNRQERLQEVERLMRSRLNFQGRTVAFSSERSDALWWLMTSADTNAVRLLLLLLESRQWQEEVPRLLAGILARQYRGAWDLTVANAWGALAVEKFSRAFEGTPVTGTTTASLNGSTREVAWGSTPAGEMFGFPWPGKGATLRIAHTGGGHPWVMLESRAAVALKAPLASGYRIIKELSPARSATTGRFARGDIVHVRLAIEADRDMTWVVVHDPIPAGASHLGTGLGRGLQPTDWGSPLPGNALPTFEERAMEGYRAYYEFLPKGTLHIEYTMRLNQSGRFHLPPTRVEALYAPEMFGEFPNEAIEVHP